MISTELTINVQEVDPATHKVIDFNDMTDVQKATAKKLLEFFGRNAETISNILLEAYDEFEDISNEEDEFSE